MRQKIEFRLMTLVLIWGLLGSLGACDRSPPRVEVQPAVSHATAAPSPTPSASAIASAVVEASAPLSLEERAEQLARRFIIADGHIDLPYRLQQSRGKDGRLTEDIARRTKQGDFDYPRARQGGLDAPFMSIYIPAKYQSGGAKAVADDLISMVESIVNQSPEQFALAHSVAEVKKNFRDGKISLPLGIENGAAIEKDLKNLEHFYRRGVRYITLTHSKDNQICDSSYDTRRTWKGLSPFGKKVVREMNRLGILIDVSHVSDPAFEQVVQLSAVPVIASHSSCRHFVPKFERNMSDSMIRKLAKNGGVIMINFGSSFLTEASNRYFRDLWRAASGFAAQKGLDRRDPKVDAFKEDYRRKHPPVFATVDSVVDHIDHVVKLVGIDHVGLGSDFDGVGDSLPQGLKDVSQYPNLIRALLERGYREADLEKLCSGNLFRVWEANERYAKSQAQTNSPAD